MFCWKDTILHLRPLKKVAILKNKNIPLTNTKDFNFEVKIDNIDPVYSLEKFDKISIARHFKVKDLASFYEDENIIEFEIILNENGKEPSEHDMTLFEKGVISLYRQKYTFDIIFAIIDEYYRHIIFTQLDPLGYYPEDHDFIKEDIKDYIFESKGVKLEQETKTNDFSVKVNNKLNRKEIYWYNDILLYSIHNDYEYMIPHILQNIVHYYNNSSFIKIMQIAKASKKQIKQAVVCLIDEMKNLA